MPVHLSRPALALIAFAALLGAGAVALGALAAHALTEPERGFAGTASLFAFIHALAILFTASLLDRLATGSWPWHLALLAALLFCAGTVLFSGGLAGLATGLYAVGAAPWGGTALIAGWVALAAAAVTALMRKRD